MLILTSNWNLEIGFLKHLHLIFFEVFLEFWSFYLLPFT